jgi:hypothetical protein
MTKKKLNRVGYLTAFLTFAIASFIMFGHYHGWSGDLERKGILFIPVALIANLGVFVFILIKGSRIGENGTFRSIYVMLLNIPVAFFCFWFAMFLMGYYRVTVINDTSSKITQINLSGCDEKSIKKLDAGESATVWIRLDHNCSLRIGYLDKNKKTNADVVAGYLCSGMGQGDDYYISGNGNPKY